jgi:hypothetical protein
MVREQGEGKDLEAVGLFGERQTSRDTITECRRSQRPAADAVRLLEIVTAACRGGRRAPVN